MKFILRVDDCGWTPDKEPDANLDFFLEWRDAAGLAGLPVVYGFIPTMVIDDDLAILAKQLSGAEELAVHGHDHAKGAIVSDLQMEAALRRFRDHGLTCRSYIPPFNAYDYCEVEAWIRAMRGSGIEPHSPNYFFGGFPDDGQSLNLGNLPCIISRQAAMAYHVPADRHYYDRARPLIERVRAVAGKGTESGAPAVLTLHCTWDAKDLAGVGELVKAVREHLVSPNAVDVWYRQYSGWKM